MARGISIKMVAYFPLNFSAIFLCIWNWEYNGKIDRNNLYGEGLTFNKWLTWKNICDLFNLCVQRNRWKRKCWNPGNCCWRNLKSHSLFYSVVRCACNIFFHFSDGRWKMCISRMTIFSICEKNNSDEKFL